MLSVYKQFFSQETITSLEGASDEEVFLFIIQNFKIDQKSQAKHPVNLTLRDDDFIHLTRFTCGDIWKITDLVKLPYKIQTPLPYSFTSHEGFFILCCRLAWPFRVETLSLLLGWRISQLSECFNWMLKFID